MTKLSKYFTWEEATVTGSGLCNEPEGLELKSNIIQCAAHMDKIRELFNKPIKVNSWYRSLAVNKSVGGAKTSAHMSGWAVDFKVVGMHDIEVALRIANSGLHFDQLILEPGWNHISFAPEMRMQTLTLKKVGSAYLQGIVL